MRRYAIVLLTSLVLLAGCSTGTKPIETMPPVSDAAATQNAPSSGESAQTTSLPATTMHPAPSARATTPVAGAKVTVTRTFFKSWTDSIHYVHYEIVVEVKNEGGKPADIHRGDQSYTIYGKDESVLETGNFTYEFPQVLKPGDLGYYIAGSIFDEGTKLADVGNVDPSISYGDTDSEVVAWTITGLKVSKDSLFGGAQVTGVAKNTDTEDATMGVVGVVLFDAKDNILGGVVDNTDCMTLRAGQSKGFKTAYPGTPPLSVSAVKSMKAFGLNYKFF